MTFLAARGITGGTTPADSGSVAGWAAQAMTEPVKSGTISVNGGMLDSNGGSTSAQMAQILYNLPGK